MKKLIFIATLAISLFLLQACKSSCNCGYAQSSQESSVEAAG